MKIRNAEKINVWDAVKVIQSGNRVIIPLGCGEPETILEAMVTDKDRLKNVEIVSGLLKNYTFLQPGLEESFHFRTWSCTPAIAKWIGKSVHYMPVRQWEVPPLFRKDGPYPIDVAIIHVSPPDSHGFCSLGVSISHSLPTALEAETVIAVVNEHMPRVLGDSFIHSSQIDYFVESSRPLVEFPAVDEVGEIEKQIAAYIVDLIPNGATLQIGIGGVPSAVMDLLSERRDIKIFGLGVDSIVHLVEKGVIQRGIDKSGLRPIVSGEFLGTKKLFEFIHDNPMVEGKPGPYSLNPRVIASINNFISIQSAIEVDVLGQVNVETIRGKPFSAIGGSHDFLQGTYMSEGGKSILAIPSTASGGKLSRIVVGFVPGTAVAHPRHSVSYIVTEYGVACLRGKTLGERIKEMIAIAHPDFREELRKASNKMF